MSSILTLPNETLHMICSLLPPCDRVRFCTDDRVEHDQPQIIILRWVSRRFRAISCDLDFWYEDDFDFSMLLPSNDSEELLTIRY